MAVKRASPKRAPGAKPLAKLHPAEQYAADVLAGRIVVGKWIRLAVERHARDLRDGHKRDLAFDRDAAERVIRFFGFLRHSKGEWAGQPFELSPWQQFFLWVLFGWKRKSTGCRRFRVAYAEIARKNGKSTLAAGIGLYLFIADGEQGAELYTAATMREQARIVHSEAVRMVQASPELRARVRVVKDNMSIAATNSKFQPLGADANTLDGLNPHGMIVDELHAHKTRALWDVLETATGARRQSLLFAITTAGFDRQSVCWEQHEYSERVLSGLVDDDSFFAWIAAIDDGDDWADERCWPKANPNLGVSCKLSEMREKCTKAKASPPAQNGFRRLRLNQWTEQDERWLDMDVWQRCAGPVKRRDLHKCRCIGGLDLGSTGDITSLVLLFDRHERFQLLPFFWVPQDRIAERVKRDRIRYDVWVQKGLIRTTPGNVTDYDAVRKDLNALADEFAIQEIAVDRLFQGAQLCTQLMGDGFDVIAFGQGFMSMAAPTKEFERLLLEGKIDHGANPVLDWMAGNVTVEMDSAGNMKPSKKKSRDKIDGIVAAIMAIGRVIVAEPGGSVYDTRGCDLFDDSDEAVEAEEDDDQASPYDDEDFEL